MINSVKNFKETIFIIIPVYGCASNLNELYLRIKKVCAEMNVDYAIIFINDASPDNSWEIVTKLAWEDKKIKGLNLSRNFGQHNAITAGLDHNEGDWVVVMDGDLQDQPEEIRNFYLKAKEGFDIVVGQRTLRNDPFIRKICSKFFYQVFDYLAGTKNDATVANFGIYSKKVIEAAKQLREQNRFFPYLINWAGFKKTAIEINHGERKSGKSSYSFKKLFKLALNNIIAHSNKPLKISMFFGFLISLISFVYALYLVIEFLHTKVPVPGWTSVMVSIWFIGGLIFANLGILGLYLGRVFDETKNRPHYLIKDKINFE